MPKQIKLSVLFFGFAALFFMACNSVYTPKPTGYYQINFPEKKYQLFDQPGYPYAFEYPTYAKVVKDSTFFGEATENEWWINVDFPQFNGRIYVSYKEIGKYKFDSLVKHSFFMTSKQSAKAYSIDDSLVNTPNGVSGMFFTVGGDAATSNQFFFNGLYQTFFKRRPIF